MRYQSFETLPICLPVDCHLLDDVGLTCLNDFNRGLISAAGELGISRIWFFTSERNRPFYEKLGFREDFSFFSPEVRDYVLSEKMSLAMSRQVE